ALVLLLPLRAVAGGVLAGQMLERHVVASSPSAQHAAPADCEGHHASPPVASTGAGESMPPDGAGCATCQACSAAALTPSVRLPAVVPLRQAQPDRTVPGHASAEPMLAFKPPRG